MVLHKRSNIVLLGFMASGKSRIGQILAKRLGYDLFDLDIIIEREEGQCIKDIFEEKGEWYFRNLESKAIKKLMHCDHAVIVTGGGAPTCFENVSLLKRLGELYYLDANFSLIIKRLQANESRPLGKVHSNDDLEKIKALYNFRRPIYMGSGHTIDVSHEDKSKTCDEIIERFKACNRLAKATHTNIHATENAYQIFHKYHSLDHVGDIVLSLGLKDYKPVIITSDRLGEILRDAIKKISMKLGNAVPTITIIDGEKYKNLASIHKIHEHMFRLALTRKTLVIALGGGNIGDVAGFAAAIFLRGVPFVQIPTTLLAMIDASIGGKTGVDVEFGKNLLGAFYNPKAVIIDPTLLSSLPKEEFSCGMAEVIKHAIIADKELFYLLKSDAFDLINVIERALKVKADIVFNDPRESNVRAHLNLGHTFAHAIEKVSDYKIKHGEAVAMGLVMACELSRSLGLLEEDFQSDLKELLKKFDLPIGLPRGIKKSDLIAAMKYDKKRDSMGLKFVLPKKLGDICVQYVEEKDLRSL